MGRKILDRLSKAHADKPDSPEKLTQPIRRPSTAMSVGGLRDGLERITNNSIRDIDPAVIEQDGLRDRLPFGAEDIADLAESIRQHGQQVPILVRPATTPGHYRIIYGRRRLAAIRSIGGTVKAIVRTLDDRQSVIAQGQENSLRLDPSFIEKAVFIAAMRDEGYDTAVIREALGISKQSVSTHVVVLDAIPLSVIEAIGPAHDTGRRKWTELADLSRHHNVNLPALLDRISTDLMAQTSSSSRFDIVLANAIAEAEGAKARLSDPSRSVHRGGQEKSLTSRSGQTIAIVRSNPREIQIRLSRKAAPEFSSWLEAKLDDAIRELHDRWQEESQERN